MQTPDQGINTGIYADPYETSALEDFLVRFNRKLELLVELLQHEQQSLSQGTADEISQAAQSKLDHIQKLSQFIANNFNKSSRQTNSDLDQSLKMINIVCVERDIKLWAESQELIRFCQNLSDENSILLANRLKYTNSALDTLYSLTGSQPNKTYDDNGHSKHPNVSRQLASV